MLGGSEENEESLLRPKPVKISGIADIQICAFKVFVLSPHHVSGNKHPKNDCIGPLELFVTFRRSIYATFSFPPLLSDHLLVVQIH